jgi:hypothetical protein
MASKSIVALVAIVILIVAFSIYAGVTFPRTIVNTSVSFTVGVDSKTTAFDQPLLNNKVQVEVTVQNGASLWRAQIRSGDQVIWEHSAAQGDQQSYNSGWIDLPSGNYNFTFGIVGIGSLDATATVTSKGGLW